MTRSFLPGFEPGTLLRVTKAYDGTRVMVLPDVSGYEMGVARAEDLMISLEYKHGWNKVFTSSGVIGWVLTAALEKVSTPQDVESLGELRPALVGDD